VNSYTGVAYKNDPSIIAFEISNEPHHQEPEAKVTEFINRMVKAMRNTGTKKPIFYNISHSIHLADAYFKSNIQGGTFQWYPTNLGAGHELKGNMLPNVERYDIPFAPAPGFKKMARIVYEFDAADVGRSYIYPAMARSFRTAGMQIATHFAYDPTFMAHVNTEYGTHFMNLAYAPQKALSLMIASEVFHRIPMYKDFGKYPGNTSFGEFSINYEKDLAEMISPTTYLYTNNTSSKLPDASRLDKIAGFGNSSIIQFEGAGAYFLDKLSNGVWRLEVMPDAIWTRDPFEKTSLKKSVAAIRWNTWPMSINLPDLGESYSIQGVNEGNSFTARAQGKQFHVSPGTYLLVRNGVENRVKPTDRFRKMMVKEFSAPKSSITDLVVGHEAAKSLTAGSGYPITATIHSPEGIQSVALFAAAPGSWMEQIPMEKESGYRYKATIPERFITEGFLRYHIVVNRDGKSYCYPSGLQTHPWDWDFYDRAPYQVAVIGKGQPIVLFKAATDTDQLMRPWIRDSGVIPRADGSAELEVPIDKLFVPDLENKTAAGIYDYSIRHFIGDRLIRRKGETNASTKIIFRGRSMNSRPEKVQVALVTKKGEAFGALISLSEQSADHAISLSDLKPVQLVSLPRPYPTFLPYFTGPATTNRFDMNDVEGLQISIGPGLDQDEAKATHAITIESISLE
jgi:hypothetical protein